MKTLLQSHQRYEYSSGLSLDCAQAGVAFRIPLIASANPANVTVQDRLALRPVVVGESSSDQVKVVNSGGSGRFRWCQEEFVSTLLKDFNAETVMPTALTLEPETFSLAANAKTIVQVSFTSSCEEELKTTLCLVTEGSEVCLLLKLLANVCIDRSSNEWTFLANAPDRGSL